MSGSQRDNVSLQMKRRIILLMALLGFCGCSRFEGMFSFLRDPPKIDRLPGVYALDRDVYSYSSLKSEGYTELSGTITLRADGTFSIAQIPDCCVFGEYGFFGGYFDGAGKWSVEKSSSVYNVRLEFAQKHRTGPSSTKLPVEPSSFPITITKGESYGLAFPLFDGEFQFAYYRKGGNAG